MQSAFKYDNPVSSVIEGIKKLKTIPRKKGFHVDEKKCLEIIDKVSKEYAKTIEFIAPLINHVAAFVPERRMRKLHIGLFGYARSLDRIILPRAIGFCAACYSIGLPPEILGLGILSNDEIDYLKTIYVNFDYDMQTAMICFNEDVFDILSGEIRNFLRTDFCDYKINQEHNLITSRIINSIKKGDSKNLQAMMIEAAHLRKFLG